MNKIEQLINHLRGDDPIVEEIFMNGNCGNFGLALQLAFPSGTCLCTNDHVVFELDGQYYDIRGNVTNQIDPTTLTMYHPNDGMYNAYDFESRGSAY